MAQGWMGPDLKKYHEIIVANVRRERVRAHTHTPIHTFHLHNNFNGYNHQHLLAYLYTVSGAPSSLWKSACYLALAVEYEPENK